MIRIGRSGPVFQATGLGELHTWVEILVLLLSLQPWTEHSLVLHCKWYLIPKAG